MPTAANVLLEAWSVCDTPQRKRTAGMLGDRWPGKDFLPKESEKTSLLSALPSLSFLQCYCSFVVKRDTGCSTYMLHMFKNMTIMRCAYLDDANTFNA